MCLKFEDGRDLNGRFCSLLRKSLSFETDEMAVSTFSEPHDIVSYIKRRYIDSGQAITSCLQDVLKAQRPRTIQESLRNIDMTVNQLVLFKNMDYLHLLTQALLDNLVIKCFRQADVEEYYLNLNKYILEDFSHSTPAASPAHHEDTGLNTSMAKILNQTESCLTEDLAKKQDFSQSYLVKKQCQLQQLQGTYAWVNLYQ